jgi:SAM-dependent methyltransferase
MSDLHSHIRWRAIEPKIPPVSNLIDVGCGDGALTLEVAQARPQASVRGVDLDAKAIAIAENTRKDLGVDNISYECADVRSMPFGTVDGALLLDIIEHLDDDHTLFTSLGDAVKAGGFLLISTPTPNFPRFFGREFHKAVGHVRDGYTRRQIESLLEVGKFELESCSYYTKLPSAAACALFYRYLWRGKLGVFASPLLNVVSLLDCVWPSTRWACSILVVARKKSES